MATIQARVELPYDVGSPWKLIVNGSSAVISNHSARLLEQLGLPVTSEGVQPVATLQAFQEEDLEGIKLSKKAKRLLMGQRA